MMINNTRTIRLVSLPAKLCSLRPFTFSQFLLYLNLSERLDDVAHLDVAPVDE
jgi:hypothetical protein